MRTRPDLYRSLLSILVALILAALTSCEPVPLRWRYTNDDINKITMYHWRVTEAAQDSINDMVEQWWITRENWDCGTVTQSDIDSIETGLMKYTE